VLIIKRNNINNSIRMLLLILAIIAALLIGISVYLGFVFGRPHSVGIIGGSDGPTAIYLNGSKFGINSFAGYGYMVIENNTLFFDEVEIITSDDVERITELGLIEQRDYPNGFYILHLNKGIVEYELTDDTVYNFRYPPAQTVPFFIQVKDGKVISVSEELRFTI